VADLDLSSPLPSELLEPSPPSVEESVPAAGDAALTAEDEWMSQMDEGTSAPTLRALHHGSIAACTHQIYVPGTVRKEVKQVSSSPSRCRCHCRRVGAVCGRGERDVAPAAQGCACAVDRLRGPGCGRRGQPTPRAPQADKGVEAEVRPPQGRHTLGWCSNRPRGQCFLLCVNGSVGSRVKPPHRCWATVGSGLMCQQGSRTRARSSRDFQFVCDTLMVVCDA
jgi:hypothetical protein